MSNYDCIRKQLQNYRFQDPTIFNGHLKAVAEKHNISVNKSISSLSELCPSSPISASYHTESLSFSITSSRSVSYDGFHNTVISTCIA